MTVVMATGILFEFEATDSFFIKGADLIEADFAQCAAKVIELAHAIVVKWYWNG